MCFKRSAIVFSLIYAITFLSFSISSSDAEENLFAEEIGPWKSIGRINKDGGYCTGILVNSNKVLTAAHCLWNTKSNNWISPELVHFLPGYNKGEYEGHATGVSYVLPEGLVNLEKLNNIDRSQDWAVLTINDSLGDELGWLNVKSEEEALEKFKGLEISQAGYSKDYEYILTGDKACEIKNIIKIGRNLDSVFHHSCNTGRGDAGAPLLVKENGEYKIVGMHSSRIKRRDNSDISIAIPGHSFAEHIQIEIDDLR